MKKSIQFLNLNKVFWPKEKITKGDVIQYYRKNSAKILPYLKNRPLTVLRCPDGIKGECWVQKEAPENLPKFIKTITLGKKNSNEKIQYPVCNNLDSLLWFVNQGAIEFHIWLSHLPKLNQPDWMIFDIDLEPGTKLNQAKKAMLLIKKELENLGQKNLWVKTTGKTGLHLLVNVRNLTYLKTRNIARKIINALDKKYPAIIATEARKEKRKGLVYIDPAQNARGRTMVAPFSLRAVDGATISQPLSWEEFGKDFKQENYRLFRA